MGEQHVTGKERGRKEEEKEGKEGKEGKEERGNGCVPVYVLLSLSTDAVPGNKIYINALRSHSSLLPSFIYSSVSLCFVFRNGCVS